MDAENLSPLGVLTVSDDGKKLAVLNNFEFTLVDSNTGKKLIRHHWPRVNNDSDVLSLAVSPDQGAIARGCVDGTVHLYDAVTGREKLQFVLAKNARDHVPLAMQFSADGKKIYVVPSGKAAIMVVETQGGKEVQALDFAGRVDDACNLVISYKRQLLAAIQRDRTVIWDLTTGKRRHFFENKAGPYWAAFSPEGSLFAVNTTGMELVLLDLSSGKERRRLLSPYLVHTVAFAPDGKTIAAANNVGCITLWDVATGKQKAPSPDPNHVRWLRFVNQGNQMLSLGDNLSIGDCIDWWSVSSTSLVRRLAGDGKWFNGYTLSVSPDAKLLAVDLVDLHTVKKGEFSESNLVLMDCVTRAKVHALKEDKCFVASTAFSPDGSLLFTSAFKFGPAGASNPHVTIWEVATGKLLRKMNTFVAVEKLAVSPDGRWIAGQSYTKGLGDYGISLWEVETGKLVHHLSPFPERTLALVFSADSSRLASVGNTTGRGFYGEVHLWDTATGKEVRAFTGHKDIVHAVAMTTDGRTLATSSMDDTVRLWEVATGKERGRITGHEQTVGSIDFSPDGRILAAASSDAPIYLWNTYAVQKSKLTGANLTRKEREGLWEKLADDAGEIAFQLICELIAHPSEAVAILEGAWKRLPRATSQQMRKWITDLNSDQFTIRKTATAELERFGADHEALLREALKQPGSLETRQRLEKILGRVNQEGPAPRPHVGSPRTPPHRAGTPVLARVGRAER